MFGSGMDPGLPIKNVTNPKRGCLTSIFVTFCENPCKIEGLPWIHHWDPRMLFDGNETFSTCQPTDYIHFPIVTSSPTFNMSKSATSQDRYISWLETEHGINNKCDDLSMFHETFIKNCSWRRQSCNGRYEHYWHSVFFRNSRSWHYNCIDNLGNFV